jgi:hypothetical protein
MASPLTDIVAAPYRKIAYRVFAVLGVILGAVQVGYGAASAPQPSWLLIALSVCAFLGGAFGFTAASNVHPGREA